MALSKAIELDSGISGEYSKILELKHDIRSGSITLAVGLYKDSAARQAGKSPLVEEFYHFSGGENPCTISAMDEADSNPIKLGYVKLKTLAKYSGASDV